MLNELIEKLKGQLIVSCQAEGDSPFNSPEGVTMFAKAAIMGGAAAIRSEGIEKTKMIIEQTQVPVIGLIKSKFEDGSVRITGSLKDVKDLISIGTHIIAIDGTFRKREKLTGPEFIKKVKSDFNCLVMADIAKEDEAIACAEAGADIVSTTLNGYTPETVGDKIKSPNFELVKSLVDKIKIPIIAEGRINTPQDAKRMIDLGAFAVVVGTAITRPHIVTSWFVEAMKKV
ncbi:Putative N-acetylmannosamine-6-phosphate epimerase [Ignavibacterium album JCM 16511]|uniref:Putative N-acetylmannosamine-6-phosphate 2-epimerase n=1 Tax=Ignavibacterium album (strain DSM 19864 / JCM 16511 / NBRC 101810 / Mat9-16) TaxID=945713 RepID=I0AIB5_IGNAJ|nr:N-acetylmannosamine-6-phosphate 2-epimerase [Ignavibacterium album]AFH48722.1 Putative N-acetylmannosamine-6-phosphate epimerase [Ignavibacterium album JCM 16511]